jgi:hypothetical protein
VNLVEGVRQEQWFPELFPDARLAPLLLIDRESETNLPFWQIPPADQARQSRHLQPSQRLRREENVVLAFGASERSAGLLKVYASIQAKRRGLIES